MKINTRHRKIREKLETIAAGLASFGLFAAAMFTYVYRSQAENMTEAAKATEYYDMRLSGFQTMSYYEKENDDEYKYLKQKRENALKEYTYWEKNRSLKGHKWKFLDWMTKGKEYQKD